MSDKNCTRRGLLLRKIKSDWDELNISFKSLIIVGVILFLVVVSIAFFSNGGQGIKNSIEVVFRTTLASIFGFLLSSNIKFNKNKKGIKIEEIKNELSKIEKEIEVLDDDIREENQSCKLGEYYDYQDVNLVQISIAMGICIICISVLGALLVTDNLDNIQTISQLRDMMCSSVGFLIGESKKK